MIPGGNHKPVATWGDRRRARRRRAQLLQNTVDSWRQLGLHVHVLEGQRTICITGSCIGLPTVTTAEARLRGRRVMG